MKKSILRTSLALAVAGVLGTSVVAYAAEATQIQPVPVVKQETALSAAIKPAANETAKPAVTETAKPATAEVAKPAVAETAQPVVVPAIANPAAASMDADTTPVVAKDDKKDAKTTKVVKTETKDHKTTKVVKSNKKVQPTQSVKTQKADETDKAHK